MSKHLNITLAQLNPVVGDLAGNLDKIRHVRDNAPADTDIIIFPEMIITGYPPEDLVLKPTFINHIKNHVEQLVKESKNDQKGLLISAPWHIDNKLYNAALLIHDGEIRHTVLKSKLPNYGVFDEERIFEAAPLQDTVKFKDVRLGIMICEDMWHKDSAIHLKHNGAELLIAVNASPFEIGKNETRIQHATMRTLETGLPLIYVNQIGGQDEIVFDGASFILDENGALVFQAEEFIESVHHTTWEKFSESNWLIKISEQTTPTYDRIEGMYQALITGLKDYVQKNNFPGVLIGMSGGIDSALSAAIAVDALGADAVRCIMMPSPFTSEESLQDAESCARALGAHYDTIPIAPLMNSAEATIKGLTGLAHENMQSRCRGLILMSLSNSTGHMVLSTGNKSEVAVGYATLYGDMCGGFNALKDIYKMDVYALSRWRNEHTPKNAKGPKGAVIPENIITKAPSAELRPGQKDQDSLPPYEALDDILVCLIEHDMSLSEIVARGHKQETVQKIWRLLDRAEYKRRQATPGTKITPRAFGRDRRYPITNKFFDMNINSENGTE